MTPIERLVRPNILRLTPYSTARDEGNGADSINIWLDANENPYGKDRINRYPDPHQKALKEMVSEITDLSTDMIFVGNGSDEAIDLMYRIFCRPGIDNAVAISPTYGMYGVAADINDIEYRQVNLKNDYSFQPEELLAATDDNSKVIWICSPNNPTGNAFPSETIAKTAELFKGIVVVDEAYYHFNDRSGNAVDLLKDHENIVVLRTLSKAYGLASIRVGFAFASPLIIEVMDRVKYPYNVNVLSQQKAIEILQQRDTFEKYVDEAKTEREKLSEAISKAECVEMVYPSDANFILVKVADGRATELYDFLKERGILVRNRSSVKGCESCLRLTIGTPAENRETITAVMQFN